MATSHRYPDSHTITHEQLSNGITVLVYETPHTESVVLSGSLRTGSIYEPLTQNGLASLTAASLLRGTQSHTADALSTRLEDIGAELDFGGGKYRMSVSGRCLAEDLPTLLTTLAEALRTPTFPDDEIEMLRAQRRTELKYAQQSTRYIANETFRQALFPAGHPYYYASYGSLESLPLLTPERLREFHAATYGAEGMILAIVGAVDADDAIAQVRDLLGEWVNPQQPAEPTLPPVAAPQQMTRHSAALPGKTQSDIVLGTVGPSRYAPDYLAAALANSILGEFGMMGRIGNVIREELGLAYYAYSRLATGQGPGIWQVTMGVAPHNVELALDNAREQIRRLTHTPLPADDLDDNQSYFTGRLPLRLESNGGLASTLHSMARYGLGLDYITQYRERILSITAAEVQTAARAYLNPDALVISIAGPDEA